MKQKINLLILISSIVIVGLCYMQYYLIKTAYENKVTQFKNEVKEKINKITDDYKSIDNPIFYEKDYLYKKLAENYLVDKSIRLQIKNRLLQNEFKKRLTINLQKEFEKQYPNNSIEFALVLNKFVMLNSSKKADTVFSENPLIENKICGNLTSLDDAFLIRNYIGTTSNNSLNSNYKLLTEDSLYVSVKNWEYIVLKRMYFLLFLSLSSIIVLVIIFVTTIKALIEQKKISDIKTDFINNITHELKTPLTTLSVSTKILERKEIKENEQSYNELISTINRQNDRLQNLIDQVMSNSLGFKEIELNKDKVKIISLLKNCIEDFKITNSSINIKTFFNSEELILNIDKFHLTTAIANVLENAVKYGSSEISVVTSFHKNIFNINIQDNGIGIEKKHQILLFDKFYRVESKNTHNTKGLGLGLYYVNQIIKAHNGSVNIISEIGKGSKFTLSIPSTN